MNMAQKRSGKMYLIYWMENKNRIWIMSEDEKINKALHDIYNKKNVEDVRYVQIRGIWEQYTE